MTPDVNVLVAASRSDHPHHTVVRRWLEEALAATGTGPTLALQPMVIASFLRLVTHPRIFVQPTPMAAALQFIDAILGVPGVHQPGLGAEWTILRTLCLDHASKANDVPDAWLAVAVVDQGEHLATFDRDVTRLLPRGRFTRLAIRDEHR